MTKYSNLGNDSGIYAYDIGSDYISVEFSTGKVYTYSYASAGSSNIEAMKSLAEQGHGLNSFINRNVKFKYER